MQSACPAPRCAVFSGPDEVSFGTHNVVDDTVFIFDVKVGYEDCTGDLGETPPYLFTVKLSKQ